MSSIRRRPREAGRDKTFVYAYTYDETTGGLLLNSTPRTFSNEPRPVYYEELDTLGFDRFWSYDKDASAPYLWAEANNYFYRGRKVAKTIGGSCYTAPRIEILEDPEPAGVPLRPVDIDAMVEKNRDILNGLVQDTIKKAYNTYDSVVALDIVQRALPHNAFKVLFGDTGMEFPDTYREVDDIEKYCKEQQISFLRAKSEHLPEDTWRLFGPPATVTRWCCSVHKTAPQILKLREVTKKADFTGMAFVGVRASESLARSEYKYVSKGGKHKGQYSCNPILQWNSAEVYLYIFQENLGLNRCYQKGNRRAGCLVCPRAAESKDFMSRACYPEEFDRFADIIKELYQKNFPEKDKLDQFIENGGWKARKNGRDISIGNDYTESHSAGKLILHIPSERTDWKEWIKTIGILLNEQSPYQIQFRGCQYEFHLKEENKGYRVVINEGLSKENPVFVKLLKEVFRRAASCVTCHECEADCHRGCISMHQGKIKISDACEHCAQCHKVEKGCLVYKSLEMPRGGLSVAESKSLNCYSHHAPKMDWFHQYFQYRNEFKDKHSLGSQMFKFYKRFLRDAGLMDADGKFSSMASTIEKIGLNEPVSWAIMLVNLTDAPELHWYVKRLKMSETYPREYALSLLVEDGAKESWVGDIWNAFGRLVDLPFSEVGMGTSEKKGQHIISIQRTPWQTPDARVILYSLYKFAENCGGYYQFPLSRLMDFDVEGDGISPAEIFGLDREQMTKLLSASFTLGLDNITLREEKTSADVLDLF